MAELLVPAAEREVVIDEDDAYRSAKAFYVKRSAARTPNQRSKRGRLRRQKSRGLSGLKKAPKQP